MDSFEHFPGRPDHPDFWKLSDVLLRNDGRVSEDNGGFTATVTEHIDSDVLAYVSVQRALIQCHHQQMPPTPQTVAVLAAMWVDGFIMGCGYTKGGES